MARSGRIATWSWPLLALAAASVCASACGPLPPSPPGGTSRTAPPTSRPSGTIAATPGEASETPGPGLLFLGTVDGARQLSLVEPDGGAVALPLPDPATVAVVPLLGGALVALTSDARAFRAPGGGEELAAGGAWEPLPLAADGALPPADVVFPGAAASPDGTAVAAVALQPDGGGAGAFLVVRLAERRVSVYRPAVQVAGFPPAWLPDQRLAVLERDVFDRITISLVRAADGTIEGSLPLRAPYLVTSRDGRTLAAATVDARQPGRLRVGRTADVVEGSSLPEGGPALPPGAYPTGGMALDPEGHRLAVVTRGDRPQEPARIFVFERVGDAWRETGSMAAPAGATGGTVTWLP